EDGLAEHAVQGRERAQEHRYAEQGGRLHEAHPPRGRALVREVSREEGVQPFPARVARSDAHLDEIHVPRLLHGLFMASSARFRASTLTRASPNSPRKRASTCSSTSARTRAGSSPRARATRSTWARAAAGQTCGSRPLAELVKRSTGIGPSTPAARS